MMLGVKGGRAILTTEDTEDTEDCGGSVNISEINERSGRVVDAGCACTLHSGLDYSRALTKRVSRMNFDGVGCMLRPKCHSR